MLSNMELIRNVTTKWEVNAILLREILIKEMSNVFGVYGYLLTAGVAEDNSVSPTLL